MNCIIIVSSEPTFVRISHLKQSLIEKHQTNIARFAKFNDFIYAINAEYSFKNEYKGKTKDFDENSKWWIKVCVFFAHNIKTEHVIPLWTKSFFQ